MEKYKLLYRLVSSQLNNNPADCKVSEDEVNELLSISSRNHMDYLVMGALLKMPCVSEEAKETMRPYVRSSIMRTMVQVRELKAIEKAFEEHCIKCQPMKGSRMKFIYPSPEMREMSDIDMLVENEKMDEADELMKSLGYSLAKDIKHHRIYSKGPYMTVEVHRSLYDKTVDKNQYEHFSSFANSHTIDGLNYVYDFSKEDFYVYMIAHMAKHFYTMGCGIRNLIDVYIYLDKFGKEFDTSYVTSELQLCGIKDFETNIKHLANNWMAGNELDRFDEKLFNYMLDSGIYGKDENGIWNKFADSKFRTKKVSRLKLKMWYYFPPYVYMAEYYEWLEGRKILLPIAWFVRGIKGLLHKSGAHKREMLQVIGENKIADYQEIYQRMNMHFNN